MGKHQDPDSFSFKARKFILESLKNDKEQLLKIADNRFASMNEFRKIFDNDDKFNPKLFQQEFRKSLIINDIDLTQYNLKDLTIKENKAKNKKLKITVDTDSSSSSSTGKQLSNEELREIINGRSNKVDENGELKVHWDEQGVSSIFDGVIFFIQLFLPATPELTKDESKRIGAIWLPTFSKYINTRYVEFLMPLMATAIMFKGKVKIGWEARKTELALKKPETKKKEPENDTDTTEFDKKNEDPFYKNHCIYCNVPVGTTQLKSSHEDVCKENPVIKSKKKSDTNG